MNTKIVEADRMLDAYDPSRLSTMGRKVQCKNLS